MRSSSSFSSKDDVTCADDVSEGSNKNEYIKNAKAISEATSWRQTFKCKSEPQLHSFMRQETFSVSSEPTKRMSFYPNKSPRNNAGVGKNDDVDSSLSIGDLFHTPEGVDPVIVLWGKSDKRENIDSTVIVKFILEAGEVFTHAFNKTSTTLEIEQIIADMFKVPSRIVQLKHNDQILEDDQSISDLAIERFGSVTLQLISLEQDRYPLVLNNVYPDIPTNDVLTVVVNQGVRMKEVVVEIENRVVSKPFLGGYRHKLTGLEYHHAFTQTAPRASKDNVVSRNTQTLGLNKFVDTLKDKLIQTSQTSAKQHSLHIIEGDPDRRMRKTEEESRSFQEKVLLIQRNLRSWLVKKMMLKMKEEYKKCIEWEHHEKSLKTKEKEKMKQDREAAITRPKSRGDFELLYNNLESWRQGESGRISKIGSVAVRKAELYNALETEIQMINNIEKHRIQQKRLIQKKKQEKFLEKTATPLRWYGSNGRILCMDSLDTQRAREMRELYLRMQQEDDDVHERISILEKAIQTVKKFESNLIPELLSLLAREIHILNRNLVQTNLLTLRDRIQYLFLEFMKDPTVNPEAAKHLPRQICQRTAMYKCVSCQNVLPYYKFSLHTKANDYRTCINCSWLRSVGGPRIDVNPVRHIMNAVRREELHQSSYTSVALVMQEQDFYHLIVNIWLGHSAIGGSGNIEELRLGRWDFTQNWSPWNCILLTAEELKAHLRFANPEHIYSLSFVKKIKQRHQIGRIHFSELASYSIKRTTENVRVCNMIDNYSAARARLDRENKRAWE